MKNLIPSICFICFILFSSIVMAQNSDKTSPIYDYTEHNLNNTDTIPDFDSKVNKLKITGTIYEKDGKTPAQDVILYICQPDENGDYKLKKDSNRKRYVYHRAWIKTDADGRYTFYTFIPGENHYVKELKQIQRIVKVPGQPEQELNSFFFNDDPLLPDLTLECRALVVQSILKPKKEDGMLVATRDFRIEKKSSILQ